MIQSNLLQLFPKCCIISCERLSHEPEGLLNVPEGLFCAKTKDVPESLMSRDSLVFETLDFFFFFKLPSRMSCTKTFRFHQHVFTTVPLPPGLCGSMNFDEASEHEDNVEEERPLSLSSQTDTNRPASAASGKNVAVSCSESTSAVYMNFPLKIKSRSSNRIVKIVLILPRR